MIEFELGDNLVCVETLDLWSVVGISESFYLLKKDSDTHTFTEDYLIRNFERVDVN